MISKHNLLVVRSDVSRDPTVWAWPVIVDAVEVKPAVAGVARGDIVVFLWCFLIL